MKQFVFIIIMMLSSFSTFSQSKFDKLFLFDFNCKKADVLEWIYSSELMLKRNENETGNFTINDNGNDLHIELLGVTHDNVKTMLAYNNPLFNLLKTKSYKFRFEFSNNVLFEQYLVMTYEDLSMAITMKNDLTTYFRNRGYNYLVENYPIERQIKGDTGKSLSMFKNKEEFIHKYEICDMIRVDLIYHKKEKYNLNDKITEVIDAASVCVKLSSYNTTGLIRNIENEQFLLNY